MAKKALLVIDMLKDFIDKKGALYCGPQASGIVPFIKSRIEEFRKAKDLVVFVMDSHEPDDTEFKLFGRHCVAGSGGAEPAAGLEPHKGDAIVKKTTYDGYHNSTLGTILEKGRIRDVYLTGVCTSICVMETAGSLSKRGYKVHIYKDGVADFDQGAHKFALERMKKIYGAEII